MRRIKVISMLALAGIFLASCSDMDNPAMQKEIISMDDNAVGRPYSPAVKVGNMLFVSGQIAIDPATGSMVEGGISEQTRQSLENIKALVEKAGFTMSDVVKCNVLMDTISFYGPMNEVYTEFFTVSPPARKAYSVEALPRGALVEIDAIAIK
jgi:2-iminobutanoate/2-iminopropanoate deaminase